MRYWLECGSFFREFRRHVRNTGALVPSSRFLARALVSELHQPRGPGRILEVGPGTGSVTREMWPAPSLSMVHRRPAVSVKALGTDPT